MQHGKASCAKQARLLFLNQICEIIMDSNSGDVQYNTSGMEDEVEPYPLLQGSPLSQPVSSSDFSTSASEDEDVVDNVASQQPQSTKWTLPPYPWMPAVHPFTRAPKGKSSEAAHISGHLLDMTILNSYILLSTCGEKKISHRDFQLALVREMLAQAGHEP